MPFFRVELPSALLVLEGFSDQPTPQQLDMQERYKEALKQQVGPRCQSSVYEGNGLDADKRR